MKKILFALIFTCFHFVCLSQTNNWIRANDSFGGAVTLTNASNGKLYAQYNMIRNEIYVSEDMGASWSFIPGLPVSKDDNLYNDNYFVGNAGNFYIKDSIWYRSTNEGLLFTALDSVSNKFSALAETYEGNLIGWDTMANEIFRSIDGGLSWNLAATMPSTDAFNLHAGIKLHPNGQIMASGINLLSQYIYLSSDEGLSWERAEVASGFRFRFISPSGSLFFVNSNGDIYKMPGLGQPLTSVYTFNNPGGGAAVLSTGRLLIPLNNNNLIFSDNDGDDWSLMQTDIDQVILLNTEPFADGTVFANSNDGLVRSSDGGATWDIASLGIRHAHVQHIEFISDSIYFLASNRGLWKTNDAGQQWDLLAFAKGSLYGGSFALTSTGGVVSCHNGRLNYSESGDENFIDITPNQFGNSSDNKVFVNPANDFIFVLYNSLLAISKDLGQSWEQYAGFNNASSLAFLPSGRIIIPSSLKLYISDDDGLTWSTMDDPFPSQFLGCGKVFLSPTGKLFLTPLVGNFNVESPILRSDDEGETWYNVSNNPEYSGIANLFFAANGHIYNHQSAGLYLSVNDGISWQSIPCSDDVNCYDHFITITPSQKIYRQNALLESYISSAPVTEGAYIEGQVKVDADADCSTSDAQTPLQNRILTAKQGNVVYTTNTDPNGHYIFFVDTGAYQVVAQNPSGIWWDYCEDSVAGTLPEMYVRDTVDFSAIPLAYCPLMTVNLVIPLLRRCFNNEVYVAYCNQGTEPADSAWIDIVLDPHLSLVNSAQPHELLGNNSIRFFVGDVPSGECGQFQMVVYVDCNSTVLGQTHCISAHGFPDTLCTEIPNWSGANIEASVSCQDTIVQLHLKNTGTAPSQTLGYIIIEDDVVLMTGQENYDAGEDLLLNYPANGSTWRIESEQEPGHPFSTLALAFAEGCGGYSSLGFVNQFSVNGITPSWHRMCLENIGSYDPNDKQGFPNGLGEDHEIRPGQTLDYLIRFQNTGTDTAFTVVIRDTLSPYLDPLTFRSGAGSRPFTWSLSGEGVISFTFSNIMLPDSNVNEPASHGFVQFSISPYLDIPLGSVIENDAAIYFDFNLPIITNTTWHTIEKSPLSSTLQPHFAKVESSLDVWPNPFSEYVYIRLKKKTHGTLLLNVLDSRGSLVAQKQVAGTEIEFNGKHLTAGLYWAEIRDAQGRLLGSGKLVKK